MRNMEDDKMKPTREMVGVAAVRFDALGVTKVHVWRDFEQKCMVLEPCSDSEEVTLMRVPAYCAVEETELWNKINAHKRSKMGYIPTVRAYIPDRRPNRRLVSRNQTTASRPIGLPSLKPRSYNSRSSKGTKPLSVAEVQKLVAKELGDLITGGDE
tara:strand:+ start:8251 stop:8718 length:468 start_codon:yes stop_codon:yes gene_type:complete